MEKEVDLVEVMVVDWEVKKEVVMAEDSEED